MKRITFDYCSVLLLIAVMPLASQATDLIRWAPDLETARQAAVAQNKLLLIHFWANNCEPCSTVDEQVFPRPSVAQTIHENFVPLKINADENPDLRLQFQVDRWPTDVVITPDGQIVHKMVTPLDPRQYVHRLSAIALTKSPRTSNESRWASGPQADSRFVGGPRPPGASPAWSSESPLLGQDVAQFSEHGPGPMGQNGLLPNQAARDSRFASRYDNSMQPSEGQVDEQGSAIPPNDRQPRAITNRYVEGPQRDPGNTYQPADGIQNPYLGQQPSVTRTDRFAPQSTETYAQNLRPSGQASFGLDGRCPVTLARDRVWQKGDPRWGAVHRGRTYLFVGPQEQQIFLADPDKFSPVLAGMDVVRLAVEGRVVEGDRRYGVVYDDDGRGPQPSRIYLFQSAEARNQFEQGPDRFLRPVLQAMQQGRLDALLR